MYFEAEFLTLVYQNPNLLSFNVNVEPISNVSCQFISKVVSNIRENILVALAKQEKKEMLLVVRQSLKFISVILKVDESESKSWTWWSRKNLPALYIYCFKF